MKTKTLILSMVLFIIFVATVSCSENNSEINPDTKISDVDIDSGAEDTTSETLPANLMPNDIEALDLNGRDIVFLAVTNNEANFIIEELVAIEENGETLNDAIYNRNLALSEKYNINIKSEYATSVYSEGRKSVLAGDDVYDVLLPTAQDVYTLAMNDCLVEITDIPYIDHDKIWWNKAILNDTSIANKNYFAVGDMSIHTYGSVQLLLYNFTVGENYGVDNIYDLVRAGAWTYDRMITEARKVSYDIDGNGIMDENDAYGIAHLSSSAIIFPYSADLFFIQKDSSDIPYIELSEKFITFFQKMVDDFSDDSFSMYTEKFTANNGRALAGTNGFNENRVLLYRIDLSHITSFRNMETDFGLVPTPKYDENQEKYISVIHPGAMSVVCIPVTVPSDRYDVLGRILEDMAYESYKTLRPAYIETAVKVKYSRDEDSSEMLDMIFSNYRLDLAFALSASGVNITGDMRNLLTKFDANVVSTFDKNINSYNAALEKVIDAFAD